jgi:VWFA-related protein
MKACLSLFTILVFLVGLTYSQIPTIRVDANLVLTPVWVADADGKTVRDLKPADFEVAENGINVDVARLGDPGEAPLELAMLFDMSGSVYPRFEFERQTAARFLKRIMRPDDFAFIMSIANEPQILQERTSSLDTIIWAVAGVAPTTQATAFYNSVVKAARMLCDVERPDARRVIIAFSDGEDNRSIDNQQADVLRELEHADCLFYSINPKGRSYKASFLSRRAQEEMETLASQTGGATFVADSVEELTTFYDRIADELQGQYLLGYHSPAVGGAGIYRRIVVSVHGRPDLHVRARPGYYPK